MREPSVLREAVRLVRANGGAWLAAAALFTVPVALAGPLSEAMVAPFWQPWGGRGATYVLRAFELFAHLVTEGVLVVFVLRAIAAEGKSAKATWSTTWNLGLARIRPALTASLAAFLPLVGYLFLLFIAPVALATAFGLQDELTPWFRPASAVYLAGVVGFVSVLLIYVMPVAMIDGLGGFAGYRRSRALIAASWGPALRALLPIVLAKEALAGLTHLLPLPWVGQLARDLVEVAALPLEAATSVLLYLRLRSADPTAVQDAVQVFGDSVYSASMTSSLGGPPAPSAPPAPSPPGPDPA
jgi:hypothetical protein